MKTFGGERRESAGDAGICLELDECGGDVLSGSYCGSEV